MFLQALSQKTDNVRGDVPEMAATDVASFLKGEPEYSKRRVIL